MKNIHVLPICRDTLGSRIAKIYDFSNTKLEECNFTFEFRKHSLFGLNSYIKPQNIYITSNEEIKTNDYSLALDTNIVFKVSESDLLSIKKFPHLYKKTILTTDQDLIKDGVQAIPDEFLEWFVKNPSCEQIEVEKYHQRGDVTFKDRYKIIIPKEEPKQLPDVNWKSDIIDKVWDEEPKQVTLEEEAMGLVNKFSRVGLQQRNEGIACAIIYIDELLEILNFDLGHDQTARMLIERYEKIKMIIQKL